MDGDYKRDQMRFQFQNPFKSGRKGIDCEGQFQKHLAQAFADDPTMERGRLQRFLPDQRIFVSIG